MGTIKCSYRGFFLRLENGFSEAEARAVLDRALGRPGDRDSFVMLRPGTPEEIPRQTQPRLYVKTEFRRPGDPLGKRIRHSRAVSEGRGYRAFAEAGLPVPELYVFGEQSRLRPRAGSIVVTQRVRARDASRLYIQSCDVEVGRRVAAALARIHARGLVHGDAVLRNFIPTDDRVWVLDLPRWGTATPDEVERDLSLLLGSAMRLGADHAHVNQLLYAYLEAPESPAVSLAAEWQRRVLEQAELYRRYLEDRERTREERHARRRRRPLSSERKGDGGS
jgi:tRNA A-37 threonylcarbamoyl transferase component Bud32